MTKWRSGLAVAAMLLAPSVAGATPIDFTFIGLASNANDLGVQNNMNSVLGLAVPGAHVTVTGAQADNGYTGDSHVVGPTGTSLTLGNTAGATIDGPPYTAGSTHRFITNQPGTTSEFIMQFTGLTVANVSFDLEIFPDASCANGNTCGTSNFPDFTFDVNGTNQIFQMMGVMPNTHGTYPTSPAMGLGETAPQLLTATSTLTLPAGVTELDFIDWPAAIGIDNLCINCAPSTVPEPTSLFLLGTGLIGVARKCFRRR